MGTPILPLIFVAPNDDRIRARPKASNEYPLLWSGHDAKRFSYAQYQIWNLIYQPAF